MGLIENMIAGATGYVVSEVSKSHPVRDLVNEKFGKNSNQTIEDIVKKYAASQSRIWPHYWLNLKQFANYSQIIHS